jgi:hypothetical protein
VGFEPTRIYSDGFQGYLNKNLIGLRIPKTPNHPGFLEFQENKKFEYFPIHKPVESQSNIFPTKPTKSKQNSTQNPLIYIKERAREKNIEFPSFHSFIFQS